MYADKSFHKDSEDTGDKVFSHVIKAGRRTYFMDVRSTRANDYYITVTESRKCTLDDGTVNYDRHKIFLYKEDFAKFEAGLQAAFDFVRREKPEFFAAETDSAHKRSLDEEFDSL